MNLENVGEVIATRKLHFQQAEGTEKIVTVIIGRPQCFPEPPDDYFVPYQIVGVGKEKVRYTSGIDAIQALQLVMSMIGADLTALNHELAGAIVWESGESDNDLGFPTP